MSTLDNATDSQIDLARDIIMIQASIAAIDNDFLPLYNDYMAQRAAMQGEIAKLIARLATEFGISPENLIGLTRTPETIPAFLESEKPRGRRKKAISERGNVIDIADRLASASAESLAPGLLLPRLSSSGDRPMGEPNPYGVGVIPEHLLAFPFDDPESPAAASPDPSTDVPEPTEKP